MLLLIFAVGIVAQDAVAGAPGSIADPTAWDLDQRSLAAPEEDAVDRCGPGLIYLPAIGKCTHGPDPAPPGLDPERRVSALGPQAASVRAASLACDGDGQTGPRVQVLYVRGAQAPSRYVSLLPSIRAWAADADRIFQDSAAATSGTRQIRFVHNASCEPVVLEVPVTANALASFDIMINELEAQGYQRPDRIYLAFVDTTSAGICGIGTISRDDRASEALNWNNIGPSFARVDAGCWNGKVAAHELMHNLGGVQLSAPNTSNGFHCTDEYDVMCYRDGASSPPMRTVCANTSFERLLDCGHDDYFHTAPPAGSYLATHWNPANNRFLIKGPDDPTGSIPLVRDVTPPRVTVRMPKTVRGGTRVTIRATVADNGGVASVAFGVCSRRGCSWETARKLGVDRTGPYQVRWKVPKRGTFTIISRATDASGNVKIAKKVIRVRPDQPVRRKR